MKKIVFIIYREWAYEIYKHILFFQKNNGRFEVIALITIPNFEFKRESDEVQNFVVNSNDSEGILRILDEIKPDVIFYYGWSWLVKESIFFKYLCVCLHPSPLPKYRGGSPIQHQIIQGETESAVSVFKMGGGLDDGDIYKQEPISLLGSLSEIFNSIIQVGAKITEDFIVDLINGSVKFYPQTNLLENPPLKRRKPEEGEIRLGEISKKSYIEINNLVRALTDPYPNAYIQLPEGKLLIKKVKFCSHVPVDAFLRNGLRTSSASDGPRFLSLLDGYAEITESQLV